MLTTINKILAHTSYRGGAQRIRAAMDKGRDADQEFNLADLAANRKVLISDVLWLLGEEGKSVLAVDFAIFCAISMKVPAADNAALEPELAALSGLNLSRDSLREMANRMPHVTTRGSYDNVSPVWRKRRAVKMALLARASTDPVHAAHYAAYAFTWSYQVNKHGLQEKLIELLLEDI